MQQQCGKKSQGRCDKASGCEKIQQTCQQTCVQRPKWQKALTTTQFDTFQKTRVNGTATAGVFGKPSWLTGKQVTSIQQVDERK